MARKIMFPARLGMYSKLAYSREHVSIVQNPASSRIVPLKVTTYCILMRRSDIQLVGDDAFDTK